MLNRKFAIILLSFLMLSTFQVECGRRGSSFGYGFLGGIVGSAVPTIIGNCSRPAPQPVIIQQAPQQVIRETVVVPQQPVVRETVVVPSSPTVQYQEQTVTTTTTTSKCPYCNH